MCNFEVSENDLKPIAACKTATCLKVWQEGKSPTKYKYLVI